MKQKKVAGSGMDKAYVRPSLTAIGELVNKCSGCQWIVLKVPKLKLHFRVRRQSITRAFWGKKLFESKKSV